MTLADDYINSVIEKMPAGTPLRDQIAMELGGLIAERQERGQSIEEVLGQLGDANVLAESYLSSVPLVSAAFLPRVAAKCVDGLVTLGATAVTVAVVWGLVFPGWERAPFALAGVLILNAFLFPLYTVVDECRRGTTVGKHLLGLRVVRESGARIGPGEAVVRQLPLLAQVFALDALFALFTAHHQRAFELVSKTRVVRASTEVAS